MGTINTETEELARALNVRLKGIYADLASIHAAIDGIGTLAELTTGTETKPRRIPPSIFKEAVQSIPPASHSHPATGISDATAAGRNMLTAADVAAQKTLLNLSGLNTGDQTNIAGNAATVTTINGRISAGTNITITGLGTAASPTVISATAGGTTSATFTAGVGMAWGATQTDTLTNLAGAAPTGTGGLVRVSAPTLSSLTVSGASQWLGASNPANGFISMGYGIVIGNFGYGSNCAIWAGTSVDTRQKLVSWTSATECTMIGNLTAVNLKSSGKLALTDATRTGNATLVAGTKTVTCTSIASTDIVQLTRKTAGGTLGNLTYTISAGASFTINSSDPADTSVISYLVIATA